MAYQVEFSAEAQADGEEILNYLESREAGEAGMRWFDALKKAIESLSTFPQRFPLAPENARVPYEVRQMLYGHKPHIYRILYTIEGDTVFVLHVRHGRRRRIPPGRM
ncbi:MAG: type II toxin-antitoxin system RelE/ParE family toxin [Bryobacterales bacterium]|nr:type II toxin-antitoxin system RelE/ParE family toxin [Bryobacterales bacterium]